MIDLDARIRQGLKNLTDATPIAPSFQEIRATRLTKAPRRRRRSFRIGGGVTAILLFLGIPVIALEATNPFSHSYQAGDELTARYGFSVPAKESGRHMSVTLSSGLALGTEVQRIRGLNISPGQYLPTGPLGPVYIQEIAVTMGGKPGSVTVLSAQPQDARAAAKAASDAKTPVSVRVQGISEQLWKPWGQDDSLVVTREPSPTVTVVVATGPYSFAGHVVSVQQLEALAADVKPLTKVPELAVNQLSIHGGDGELGGYWSLVQSYATRYGGTWDMVIGPSPGETLSNLMGDVIARGTTNGQRWTDRVVGDPANGHLSTESEGVSGKTLQPIFVKGVAEVSTALNEETNSAGPPKPSSSARLFYGSVPGSATSVRIVLSNGTSQLIRSFPSGRGWNFRLYGTAFPAQTAYVARVEALNAEGKVVAVNSDHIPLQGNAAWG